jgi:hypothetical protein
MNGDRVLYRAPTSQTHPGLGDLEVALRQRLPQVARPTTPEDAALYVCGCGISFKAAVSTYVTCPTCGHGQLW